MNRSHQRTKTVHTAGLKALRIERGLTVEHIAVLAGVDKSTISRAERGLNKLRPETVVKLSKALKVSPGRIQP